MIFTATSQKALKHVTETLNVMERQIFSHEHPRPRWSVLTSILHIRKSLSWVVTSIFSHADRLCKLWLRGVAASSAFLLEQCLAGRDSSGFQQPLLCRQSGLTVVPFSPPMSRERTRLISWQGTVQLGCPATGWMLKWVTLCREQVWFVHEQPEIKEAINLFQMSVPRWFWFFLVSALQSSYVTVYVCAYECGGLKCTVVGQVFHICRERPKK